MHDGPLRRLVKRLARVPFDASLALRRRRNPSRWLLSGECRSCAACCEEPSIQVDPLTFRLTPLRAPFLWWQRVVNGFEWVRNESPRVLVFRCTHFDPATRRCDSYDSRPGMCRDYPRLLLESAWPEFLPSCGHRAVDRRGEATLVALGRAGVSEAKQRELAVKLRLR